MHLLAGTSGFAYDAWIGPFYPTGTRKTDLLRRYAERLPAVEINNTFYRSPRAAVMESWAAQVPDGFVFALKAPQRITHRARLANAAEPLGWLWSAVTHLGDRLGPLLFQLPPNFKVDVPRLTDFVASLPAGCRAAFEFRHESWRAEAVHAALAEAGCALCIADEDAAPEPELVATTDWGYVRLRRPSYDDAALARWRARIAEQGWREVFVFFKHEEAGAAPLLAQGFLER